MAFLFLSDARFHLVPYLLLFLAGSLIALLAARSLSASGLPFLLLCGALFRLTLLFRDPDLSQDVFRYLWDGSVAQAGISPYAHAPDDPTVSHVSPGLRPSVEHRDVRTVYPPVAQATFRIFGGQGRLFWLKAVFAAADLFVVVWISRTGVPGAASGAALYAFHPLPITEAAGQGHLDSLGVALLLASLSYLASGRAVRSGIAFTMSVLTKYVCLVAFIPLLRRGRAAFLVSCALCAGALWLAASRGGASPWGGIGQYATRWEFNSALYPPTVRLVEVLRLPERAKDAFLSLKEKLHHPAWSQAVFPFFYSAFFARVLLGVALLGALLLIAWRVEALEGSVFASMAALLLLSPTLHPWYLLWVLPFAARRREPAFLWLSFCVPLAYALLYFQSAIPGGLVYGFEYVPFSILLVRSLWKFQRKGFGCAGASA